MNQAVQDCTIALRQFSHAARDCAAILKNLNASQNYKQQYRRYLKWLKRRNYKR
jgi:hypothetical protein